MKEQKYKIIAVLDTIEDKLIPQSLELIAFAESFTNGDLSGTLLIIPGKNVMHLCGEISAKYGVDTTALENEDLYLPNPEALTQLLPDIITEFKPEIIAFTHTIRNSQCVSKLSVMMNASSVTAVESYNHDSEAYVFRRSIFNGKLRENVRLKTPMKFITVLSGAYTLSANRPADNGKVSVSQLKSPSDIKNYRPLSLSSEADSGIKLEDADVIISAGRGIGKEENLDLLYDTATLFKNSAIGASRPICDCRWLPFNQQVGITGKTVSPKLYIACGISGSQQHIAGMKNSQCIVAINKDPHAAIFSIADYIIVEDLISFLPLLVKKYRERFIK